MTTTQSTSENTHLTVRGAWEGNLDFLEVTPLGAGSEVGRSCILLKFRGKTILLDCGIHPAYTGLASLPFFDAIENANKIDLLLISHFHLDHAAALPYFLEKTSFRGRVFMTHPTKAIYKMILTDYIKVSNISIDEMLYTEHDITKSMSKIEPLNYHQEVEVNGVKVWCYNAGHVLGAAMFMIDIAGVRILYTGDFSRQEDRHLMAAEVPAVCPDVLIVESTYGVQIHEPRVDRERRFVQTVYDIVHNRQGHCLIPVFALGRAQELLLILDEFWQTHPELHHVPIYYASSLGKKAMTVYQTYINMMNAHIRDRFAVSNPFMFQHIKTVKTVNTFEHTVGPCVVMASPGMLQSGLSRELFEMWCEDKRNGVVLTGYCVEGTLAKLLLQDPVKVTTLSGRTVPLRMSVHYISFSAHSDYQQTSGFIDILRPPNVILVHGDKNEMQRLRNALQTRYEGQNLRVLTPKNCQTVKLPFKGELTAKAIGEIVPSTPHSATPQHGQRLQGLLVAKDFRYHLLSPNDLHTYTRLHTATLTQRLRVHVQQSLTTLQRTLSQVFDDVQLIMYHNKPALSIANAVYIVAKFSSSKSDSTEISQISLSQPTIQPLSERIPDYVIIQWESNQISDTIADSVVALLALVTGMTVSDQCEPLSDSPNLPTRKEAHQNETQIKSELMEVDSDQRVTNTKEIETNPVTDGTKEHPESSSFKSSSFSISPQLAQQIHTVLTAHFGPVTRPQPHIFLLSVDGARATIDLEHRTVASNDANLRQRVLSVMTLLQSALFHATLDESKMHFFEIPLSDTVLPYSSEFSAVPSQEHTETFR